MSVQDELNPSYGEEARITVSLLNPLAEVRERRPCPLRISTIRDGVDVCAPYGLQLPIEIIVTGPRGEPDFTRVVHRRRVPRSFTFTAKSPGRHMIVVREAAHNRWFGSLSVDVIGDRTQDPEP